MHDLLKGSEPESYEKLYNDKLRDIDISILVHNASAGKPESFLDCDME